jgi:hypothetical protein
MEYCIGELLAGLCTFWPVSSTEAIGGGIGNCRSRRAARSGRRPAGC